MKSYIFFFMLIGISYILPAQIFQQVERAWPSEISQENTQSLFDKLKDGLIRYQKKHMIITLDQVNGKSVYGTIEQINLLDCVIQDPREKLHTVSFFKIRGSNFFKYIQDKHKDGETLFSIGVLFFYDQKWERAEICFQRSLLLGNSLAPIWLSKTLQELAKYAPKEETPTLEEDKPKIVVETKPQKLPEKKLPRLTIPKVAEIAGTKKINFSEHIAFGYYTLFQIYSPKSKNFTRAFLQIEEVVAQRPDMLLRQIKASFDGTTTRYIYNPQTKKWETQTLNVYTGEAVINQFKLKTLPYFILYGTNGQEIIRGEYSTIAPYLRTWMKK